MMYDVVGMYSEEEMIKYVEQCDDFDILLEDFLEGSFRENVKCEIDERTKIIKMALEKKMGLSDLETILKQSKLRSLYVRNPIEMVLSFCFLCNECENAKKYGVHEFARLWNRLSRKYKFPDYPDAIKITLKGNKPSITLEALKKYIENVSRVEENNVAATAEVTLDVSSDLSKIDVTESDAEKKLEEVFITHMDKLSSASQSIRYYVAKYIYYVICHQIMELKDVLKEFSLSTASEIYTKYSNEDESQYYGWSIRQKLVVNLSDRDLVAKRVKQITEENIHKGLNEEQGQDDVKKIASKVLLKELLSAFVLQGSPVYSEGISILLVGEEQEPIGLQKSIADLVPIFAHGKKQELHEKYVVALEELGLADFYPYSINLNKIYSLLFESIRYVGPDFSEEQDVVKEEYDNGGAFIRDILTGKRDMSRSALLMMLVAVKGALFNERWLLEAKNSLYTKESLLEIDRVNSMLNRVGYADLGDYDEDKDITEIEEIYYRLFTEEEYPITFLNALKDSMPDFVEECGNFMPFEIMKIDAAKARRNLYNEINRR